MAQLAELDLAQGLTGNPAVDLKAVATMETDFAGGIKKNMENQIAVCTVLQVTIFYMLTLPRLLVDAPLQLVRLLHLARLLQLVRLPQALWRCLAWPCLSPLR